MSVIQGLANKGLRLHSKLPKDKTSHPDHLVHKFHAPTQLNTVAPF